LIVILLNSAVIYDIEHRKVQCELVTAQNTHGAGDLVTTDGSILALCGVEGGTVSVSDLMSERPPVVFQAHQHGVAGIKFSPDGSVIATASEKGTLIRLFDSVTGMNLSVFRRGTIPSKVMAMCFSPTNSDLIVVSGKGTVHLFRADKRTTNETDAPRSVGKFAIGDVSSADCAFYSDTDLMVVGSTGHLFRLRSSGESLESLGRSFVLSH
jgi:WD40 repeat protein